MKKSLKIIFMFLLIIMNILLLELKILLKITNNNLLMRVIISKDEIDIP